VYKLIVGRDGTRRTILRTFVKITHTPRWRTTIRDKGGTSAEPPPSNTFRSFLFNSCPPVILAPARRFTLSPPVARRHHFTSLPLSPFPRRASFFFSLFLSLSPFLLVLPARRVSFPSLPSFPFRLRFAGWEYVPSTNLDSRYSVICSHARLPFRFVHPTLSPPTSFETLIFEWRRQSHCESPSTTDIATFA